MNNKSKILSVLFLLALSFAPQYSNARAFEMLGSINYSLPSFSPKPSTYTSSGGGIGYGFFGRMELGPGMIESGFVYIPFSMTTHETVIDTKFSGSFWTIPLLYRYWFWEPYLSIAAGVDYAIEGGTELSTSTGPIANGIGSFQSHFGAVASLEAKQDVGENLSVVLDVRYRMGLKNAMEYQSTSTGTTTNVKASFTTISIGIMKHLED